jgi:hypothetical protein
MRGWLAHNSVVGVSTDLADLRVAVASDDQQAARGTGRGMAIIHDTTMTPGKLELLTSWLPAQPWYFRTGRELELAKAGGFRLDDPVPLEYSTEGLTCPIASRPVAVMVGWPGAAQDRLLADVPGPRCGRAVVPR